MIVYLIAFPGIIVKLLIIYKLIQKVITETIYLLFLGYSLSQSVFEVLVINKAPAPVPVQCTCPEVQVT